MSWCEWNNWALLYYNNNIIIIFHISNHIIVSPLEAIMIWRMNKPLPVQWPTENYHDLHTWTLHKHMHLPLFLQHTITASFLVHFFPLITLRDLSPFSSTFWLHASKPYKRVSNFCFTLHTSLKKFTSTTDHNYGVKHCNSLPSTVIWNKWIYFIRVLFAILYLSSLTG